MYVNTKTRIKFTNGLGTAFTSERGVKQEDVLSPTHLNSFIDDVVKDLINGNCDPVRIGGLSVNCLSIVLVHIAQIGNYK